MPAPRRVHILQLEELVAWMESHPLLARATNLNNPQTRKLFNRQWDELASRLNAVCDGGVTKTAKEWRLYWSDQKCKVKKKKGLEMQQHASGTGGGPSWDGLLSCTEDRVLTIMVAQNVIGNENVCKNVDMSVDNSPPKPVLDPLQPVTPGFSLDPNEPTSPLSHHPSQLETTESDTATSHPSPSETRPPKRRHVAVAGADDDGPAERSRLRTAPPRRALYLERRCVREEVEQRRLALEERRLALEEARVKEERAWRRDVISAMQNCEERRLALEEAREEEERAWRRDVLSALQNCEERRLALEEARVEEEQAWRRDLLSALRKNNK